MASGKLLLITEAWFLLLLGAGWEAAAVSVCPKGYFPCDGGHQCVLQQFMCDRRRDCEDGSDEVDCYDADLKDFFNNYYTKRLDEDREKRTRRCDWIHPGCRCGGGNYSCDNADLKTVPSGISPNATQLDLSGNSFGDLHTRSFPVMKHLHVLHLTSAGITRLGEDVFMNLPKLKKVDLVGNQLRRLAGYTFNSSNSLESLKLSHNPIAEISPHAFNGLQRLTFLDLRNCCLISLSPEIFKPLGDLEQLWLDENKIKSLEVNGFRYLKKLKTLELSVNRITSLDSPFRDLEDLRTLHLGGNQLTAIADDTFWPLDKLESLSLNNNSLLSAPTQLFAPLRNLTYIYLNDFTMCSAALHVRVCEPRTDGISSLAHLLDNYVLRISVWIVAAVACFGNLLVLVGRILFHGQNEVHSFYIKNLALADLLMGIYLVIIAYHDVMYRGEYIRHDYFWRHSWKCSLCGLLSTISSEASVFTLTVITVDRFVSIMYPLSAKRRTVRFAVLCMVVVWMITVLVAIIPIMWPDYYGTDFYGNNGVCLPLHIHDPASRGWKYSAFVFCIVNSIAFTFIVYAYITMFFTITKSKIGLRSTQQQQDCAIANRFAFIVGTDFLCWMPIVVIKIVAIAGTPISGTLYAWVAVFLLPVNSALNPVLYTLTTRLFKQQLNRFVKSFKWLHRASADHHSAQSWSSSPYSRGSKKTLVTTVSDPVCSQFKCPSPHREDVFVLRSLKNAAPLVNWKRPVKRRYEDFV